MVPGVPREAQQLVCVCANEFGDAADCGEYRQAALSYYGSVGATTAQDKTITVFAAASLTNALDDVDTAFTKQTGIKVVVSYGASSALARQIDQGAPMDVFASADLRWMDYCARKKATRVNLLGNKLVLIAAKDAKIDHV